MQVKCNKTAIRDNEVVRQEYQKQKKKPAMCVTDTDAFCLHKFNREQAVTISTPTKPTQGIERLLVGSNVLSTLEHYSANIPGLLAFMKYQT